MLTIKAATRVLCAGLGLTLLIGPQAARATATISQGYYQESAIKSCPNAATCTIAFSNIPAAKTVIVQNVGCIMTLSGTLPILSSSLSSKLSNVSTQRTNYLKPFYMGTSNSIRNYNINESVLDIMNAGETPQVFISLSGTTSTIVANCSISGQIKP
jgi:hypothetical protein